LPTISIFLKYGAQKPSARYGYDVGWRRRPILHSTAGHKINQVPVPVLVPVIHRHRHYRYY
jgi:hypothetical protein